MVGMSRSFPAPDESEAVRLIEADCVCFRMQRASRAIGHHFDVAFRPLQINNWQFTLLASIARPDPLTVNGLAEHLGMDRTTTTKNLRPLERRGLLEIQRDPHDARARRIVLTGAGRELLSAAFDHWRRANAAVTSKFSDAELASLRSALDTAARVGRGDGSRQQQASAKAAKGAMT